MVRLRPQSHVVQRKLTLARHSGPIRRGNFVARELRANPAVALRLELIQKRSGAVRLAGIVAAIVWIVDIRVHRGAVIHVDYCLRKVTLLVEKCGNAAYDGRSLSKTLSLPR